MLPPIEFIDPGDMPENERELLVHDHDMTSTLSEYHGSVIDLHVIKKEASDDYLMRLVTLLRRAPGRPVECGAIGIHLEGLPEGLKRDILACEKPLGTVIEEHSLRYESKPQGFFRLRADAFFADVLLEPEGTLLHGRCNVLTLPRGEVLADIVEILPRAQHEVPPSVHRNGSAHRHRPPESA